MIEVRYAGVVVGRSAIIRELDTRGLFLGVTEPLPVGTPVVLKIGDRPGAEEVHGRVEVVSESPELASAGMRVRFADPGAAVLFGSPVQAPPEPEVSSVPAPVVVPPQAVTAPPMSVAPPPQPARDQEAPLGAVPSVQTAPRRLVVDASSEQPAEGAAEAAAAVPEATSGEEADLSVGMTGESGRIPAPDPSAFGGLGGKKNRRNRRR